MADTRTCAQCGAMFTPRREHARFCSARCRVAWNREHTGDPKAGADALDWSITAMRDATERLARDPVQDHGHGLAVISEAVWWVTLVDATLVRYHHQAYERSLESQAPDRRGAIEGTFAGLRFVRNQMGYHLDPINFIQSEEDPPDHGHDGVTAWRWRSLPEPDLGSLPHRGRAWEMRRYRAYQDQLAGHTLGDTFGRAVAFLDLVASHNQTAA